MPKSHTKDLTGRPFNDLDLRVLNAVQELIVQLQDDIYERAFALLSKLTREERQRFTVKGEFPTRLAKTLLCAIEDREPINLSLASEATLKEIKALKRINRNREI